MAEEQRVRVTAESLLITIESTRPYRMGCEYLTVAEARALASDLCRAADKATDLGRVRLRDAEAARCCR